MVTTTGGGAMMAAAAIGVAAGTMEASTAMAVGAAGIVASAAVVAAVVGAVVASAGTLLAAAIVVATADDDDIPSAPSPSSLVARMTEHLLQTLAFILQPFRRTPFSECLIRRIKINCFQRRTNSSILKLIGCYKNDNIYSINFDLYRYLMQLQQ